MEYSRLPHRIDIIRTRLIAIRRKKTKMFQCWFICINISAMLQSMESFFANFIKNPKNHCNGDENHFSTWLWWHFVDFSNFKYISSALGIFYHKWNFPKYSDMKVPRFHYTSPSLFWLPETLRLSHFSNLNVVFIRKSDTETEFLWFCTQNS